MSSVSAASIVVPGTDIRLSRLGFGCVRLTTGQDEAAAIRTLERAFDTGITHFDVARLYGMGAAEGILGAFATSRRSRITIATKVGLLPPASLAKRPGLVRLAKRALGPFPGLLKWAKRSASAGPLEFDPKVVAASFETSLKALRTDYVDVLFLHEATLADSRGDETLSFIDQQMRRGSIRCAGVGSSADRFRGQGPLPGVYRIAQFGHNVLSPGTDVLENFKDRFRIVHSAFEPAKRLVAYAGRTLGRVEAASCTAVADRLGVDLRDESAVRSLLLYYSLRTNPEGGVLFSSTSETHIAANARDFASIRFDDRQIETFARYASVALSDAGEVGK